MDLSAKMPAEQNATLPAKMPATMTSEAAKTGDNGPAMGPQGEMSQTTDPKVDYQAVGKNEGSDWQTSDKKTGSGWEATDRNQK